MSGKPLRKSYPHLPAFLVPVCDDVDERASRLAFYKSQHSLLIEASDDKEFAASLSRLAQHEQKSAGLWATLYKFRQLLLSHKLLTRTQLALYPTEPPTEDTT